MGNVWSCFSPRLNFCSQHSQPGPEHVCCRAHLPLSPFHTQLAGGSSSHLEAEGGNSPFSSSEKGEILFQGSQTITWSTYIPFSRKKTKSPQMMPVPHSSPCPSPPHLLDHSTHIGLLASRLSNYMVGIRAPEPWERVQRETRSACSRA